MRTRHPAAETRASEEAVQEIMQRQRARRMIQGAKRQLGTAYETAALLRSTLDDAVMEERLNRVEAAALDMLLEEIVARAHAEGAEWSMREIERALKEPGRQG